MPQTNFFGLVKSLRSPTVLSWYEFTWPKELKTEQVRELLYALGSNPISNSLRFVSIAEKGRIKHFIALPCHNELVLLSFFSSFLPEVALTSCEPPTLKTNSAKALKMSTKNRVLNTAYPEIVSFAILNSLQNLAKNERVVLLWILGHSKAPVQIASHITSSSSESFTGSLFEALAGKVPTKLDAIALSSMRNKYAVPSWNAAFFIGITANNRKRKNMLANRILGGLKVSEAPGVMLGTKPVSPKKLTKPFKALFWPLNINVDEILGLLHWGLAQRNTEGLGRLRYRRLPPPKHMAQTGIELADSVITGSGQKLRLSELDRMNHLEVLGPSGVGKSEFMLNMMIQDAINGHGFALVDYKGDLCQDLLKRLPAERIPDVAVIDLRNANRPIGVNPFASPQLPHLIADDILSIYRKLYGSAIGARSADLLFNALLSLMQVPGSSLCDLPALLTNRLFRKSVVEHIKDPLLLEFWWSFDRRTEADRNMITSVILNKVRPFLLRPAIKYSLGQSVPKFDVSEVFNAKKKILVVNLSKASIGSEASRLYGAFVMSLILQAIRQRASLPPEARIPAFLYIDEAQEYWRSHDDFTEALEQFRSNRVGITFAHQFLGQLSQEKREALVNTRNRIVFQVGHSDAVTMARTSEILTPEDFENLPNHQIYAQLAHNGEVLPWTSGITIQKMAPMNKLEEVMRISREQYGVDAKDIENELQSKIGAISPIVLTSPIGRKKRGTL